METKEKIKKGVVKIITESNDIKKDINTFVAKEYKKVIELKDHTNDTIKEVTRETLDGVYEGIDEVKSKGVEYADKIKKEGIEVKNLLEDSAESMITIAEEIGEETLATSKKSVEKATSIFKRAYHKAGSVIDNVDTETKEGLENAFRELKGSKIKAKKTLEEISNALRDYANEKKDETSDAIHKVVENSEFVMVELMETAKNHSKKLTNQVNTKVSDWLKNLSNKVNS